jgi:lysozyme
MSGLTNRRAAEAGLWAKGAHVASRTVAAEPAQPPMVDKETISWGAGVAASLGAAFSGTGPVPIALAAVIVVAFGVGLYFYVSKRIAK